MRFSLVVAALWIALLGTRDAAAEERVGAVAADKTYSRMISKVLVPGGVSERIRHKGPLMYSGEFLVQTDSRGVAHLTAGGLGAPRLHIDLKALEGTIAGKLGTVSVKNGQLRYRVVEGGVVRSGSVRSTGKVGVSSSLRQELRTMRALKGLPLTLKASVLAGVDLPIHWMRITDPDQLNARGRPTTFTRGEVRSGGSWVRLNARQLRAIRTSYARRRR